MTEKRVSVRLAAVGGKQVRAEFEGIGEAGKRGFGKASREMEIANARLARFARRAKIAAGIMAAAATAAGIAMVRSGLQVIDEQAKLAASLRTSTTSIQVLARAGDLAGVSMGEVEQATFQLTKRLSQAAAGTGPAVKALEQLHLTAADLEGLTVDAKVAAIQNALVAFVPDAQQAAVAAQIFGDRAGLIFTRIDSATLQQATQDVTDFRVAVSEAGAAQVQRTNDALSRMGLLWRGISNQLAVAAAPALEAVANAMASVGRTTGPLGSAIKSLFAHIGEIASIAATLAVVLGGRLVLSLGKAALGIKGVSLSLTVLRGVLIRTGIGALIVGAGELVYQFGRLVAGAGGFGNAMGLLKSVVLEVWTRIKTGAAAAGASANAMFAGIQAISATAMQSALVSVVGFGNAAANTFEGAYEAIKSIWGLLPAAIGDLTFQAANSLIEGVESMLNVVIARINGFIKGMNAGLEALGSERRITILGDLDLGGLENRFAGAASRAGSTAASAFERAFSDNPLAVPDLGLNAIAQEAHASAESYSATANELSSAALAPLTSLQALQSAVTQTGNDATTALSGATTAAQDFGTAVQNASGAGTSAGLDNTGSAAARPGSAMRDAANIASEAWEGTKAAIERTREIARGISEDITGPLKDALKSGELTWQNFAGAVSSIAQNLANRLIDNAFKPIEDALFKALSGGFGGGGGSGGGGIFSWLTRAIGGLFGGGSLFAKGGAFTSAGEITAFARGGVLSQSGIVNQPTIFPFAKGIGLMGEAGPEAILPLRRGPGGRLGVEAGGAGGTNSVGGISSSGRISQEQAPAPVTRIINVLDPSIVGDYLATPAGERAILNVIRRNRGGLDA